jgi:hypothetical protein
LAAIAFRPAPALLVAQAAGIGVFMALMGGYLYRIFSRKDRWSKGIESTPSDSSQGSQKIETVDDEDSSESEDRPAEHVHSTVSNYDPPDSPSHYDT